MAPDDPAELEELIRRICLALPGTTERSSHGSPAFFCPRQFLALHLDGHHQNQFPHLWFAAPAGVQAELVEREPDRFFVPPYVGSRGWVGLRLVDVDPEELGAICGEAHATVAGR